ncbi:MAG: hypothetical protein Q9169_003832 [Polycauliona sp. 2 TL-2023]
MADQKKPATGIPRLSRLPVRSGTPSIAGPETLIGSGPTISQTKLKPTEIQRPKPPPASSKLTKVRGAEAKVFVNPLSSIALSRAKEGLPTQGKKGDNNDVPQRYSSNQEAFRPNGKGPRPSLSDRAAQSLAHIPPSPSPRRRQSGFFPSDSPAVRPPSSLGRNRPATSAGFHPPLPTSRTTSPSKRPRLPANPPASISARKPTVTANRPTTLGPPHLKGAPTVHNPVNASSKSALKSSAALRETIANAKAARRAAPNYDGDDIAKPIKIAQSFNDFPAINIEDNDLHVNRLRKRITSAKSDGKLDISGMRLKVFPQEALNMDSMTDGPAWYESVDLIRLNAADNELEELGWDQPAEEDVDKPSPADVFAALQTLDLHKNKLHNLPSMLPTLSSLTILNLSRNRLKDPINDILNNISHIPSLRILDISCNQFSGPFPSLSERQNLEDLNIHSNAFTSLPAELFSCKNLRTLNASNNKLSQLPAINLPNLITLNLSSNQIPIDDLVAPETSMPKLTTLDISRCRVDHLPLPPLPSKFPALKTLIAFDNQISHLDIENVRGLEILDFKGNDLRSLPAELSLLGLKKLLVGGNPMRAPRREILEGSTERLMGWLRGRLPAGVGDEVDETF